MDLNSLLRLIYSSHCTTYALEAHKASLVCEARGMFLEEVAYDMMGILIPPFVLQKALSRVMFLTPHLPAFLLQRRLTSHIFEIRHLDTSLFQLGVNELTDEEVKKVRTLFLYYIC